MQAMLSENATGVVGALPNAAVDPYLSVSGKLAHARSQLPQRNIDRTWNRSSVKLVRLTHVQEKRFCGIQFIPRRNIRIAANHIGRDHARHVYWIFRCTVLGRVAELCYFEIEDGSLHLYCRCDHVDAACDTFI